VRHDNPALGHYRGQVAAARPVGDVPANAVSMVPAERRHPV
jgi:hypothetical protein